MQRHARLTLTYFAASADTFAVAKFPVALALRLMQRHSRLTLADFAAGPDALDWLLPVFRFSRLVHGALRWLLPENGAAALKVARTP
jgi:hypothetical protein